MNLKYFVDFHQLDSRITSCGYDHLFAKSVFVIFYSKITGLVMDKKKFCRIKKIPLYSKKNTN